MITPDARPMITVRTVERPPRDLAVQVFLLEVVKGLGVTYRHFFVNLWRHLLGLAGGRPAGSPPAAAWGGSPRGRASRPPSGRALAARGAVTVQYPEEPAVLGRRARTRHRLLKRPDGAPRCTSCLLCETVCPARCIRITAEDSPDPGIEKRARTFEIDMGLCVFCGHCVEACPVDAIRMDTGDMELPALHRREMIWDMKALMEDS